MGEQETTHALVLEIQRLSTEDGPGIRTTVFMKGCALRCAWCHNPESIAMKPQTQWIGIRCIGCRTCLAVCPHGALSMTEQGLRIDRERCRGCGRCAEECPSNALERMGRRYELDELLHEVLKDRVYFEKSGGGVTVSGGEAALQSAFVAAFFERLAQHGVHTALDTSGYVSFEALSRILPHADMVLYDLKEMDPERHRRFTDHDNQGILANFRALVAAMRTSGHPKELWVRTPLIPGATATKENLNAIGAFLRAEAAGMVGRWDLCAFNNLCRDKYQRLGLDWPYAATPLLSALELEALLETARRSGVDPDIVRAGGSTRASEGEEAPAPRAETRMSRC